MFDKVKKSLRMTSDHLDDEIRDYISAASLELKRIGVEKISEDDPLNLVAVKLYVKGRMDYSGEGDRYLANFEALAKSMALLGEYQDV